MNLVMLFNETEGLFLKREPWRSINTFALDRHHNLVAHRKNYKTEKINKRKKENKNSPKEKDLQILEQTQS